MPPWRGRHKPRRIPIDEEVASTPCAHPLQNYPSIPPKFLVPPIPQARPFPSISLEAFQAFITYWYAQAQAQAQPTLKLSKLVKKARQLGCDTFSSTVNAISIKN